MINWSKERTNLNLCGYCIGSPPSANCDGTCFEKGYTDYKKNREKHSEQKLKNISIQIKGLQHRLKDFEDERDKHTDIGLFESR